MSKNKLVPDSENNFQIGMQNASQVRTFNLSEIGREIINEIIKKYDELQEMIEEGIRQARDEAIQLAQISAYAHDKEENKEQHHESEEPFYLKQAQQRKAEEAHPPAPESTQPDPMASYVKDLDKQIQTLETKEADTKQKYDDYEESLDNADDFEISLKSNKVALKDLKINDLDLDDKNSSATTLRERLYGADGNGGLTAQHKATAEQAMKDINAGSDTQDPKHLEKLDKGKKGLAKAAAQGLEMVQLQEMLAVIEDKKFMYKKDGTKADTFGEADFLMKEDIKNPEAAKQAFETSNSQSNMINLRELIKDNKSIDMAEIENELKQARAAKQQTQNSQNATSQPEMSSASNTSSGPMGIITDNKDQLYSLSSPEKPSSGATPDPEMAEDPENRAGSSM